MMYTQTDEHEYVDETGTIYNLGDIAERGKGTVSRLHLTASTADGIEVEICTNGDGCGMWAKVNEPFGYRYDQVAGTMQYQLPKTDRGICDRLRRMVEARRDPWAAERAKIEKLADADWKSGI